MMLPKEVIETHRSNASGLAEYFSKWYFTDRPRTFPINPFQVLKDLGISFVFRNFERIEGLYMPKSDDSPIEMVVINAKRPIQRQRYSAAHELCHSLKDAGEATGSIVCASGANSYIERYAESFAAAFLIPADELATQIRGRNREERLSWDDVLAIAEFFGVSFAACYYRIRNLYPYLVPDKLPRSSVKNGYQPSVRREQLGLSDLPLLSDVLDAWDCIDFAISSDFARTVFKTDYIFNDARLEGIDTERVAVAEIVADLLNNTQNSKYCTEQYQNYCHIAGHARMYDSVFERFSAPGFNLFDTMALNKQLFSCFPYPEYGGSFREANTLVIGAKFETLDYHDISAAMTKLMGTVQELDNRHASMSRSDVVKSIAQIHHRLTVIHPFCDGNGRTSRGFANETLLRYGLPPFYVKTGDKATYTSALTEADLTGDYTKLSTFLMRSIIKSYADLFHNEL